MARGRAKLLGRIKAEASQNSAFSTRPHARRRPEQLLLKGLADILVTETVTGWWHILTLMFCHILTFMSKLISYSTLPSILFF